MSVYSLRSLNTAVPEYRAGLDRSRGGRRVPWLLAVEGESSLMRSPAKYLAIIALLLAPATAFAQATLTGTVRDTSGAVLPGVTVEAASPALIEKVRSATTDGTGQYRIIDLRPGTYSLTFTLPGFTSVKRD